MRRWLAFTASILGCVPLWADASASGQIDHWAFRPPLAVPVPSLAEDPPGRQGGGNPIDAFIDQKHDELGLEPAPTTDRRGLLRRVYIDLTGLPPSRRDMALFVADASPDAYEKVVRRLLASPAYGERWGRHWLDVWRYADWSGEVNNQARGSPRHMWRWRDWVIESLSADKPYDRMVREMLAGDEIAPGDPDTLRATGFLARNWYKFNRNVWLDDTVEHTAKAFLALTFNCARCHDHKYDPFAQEDYYRLRAFFEPYDIRTERVAGESDLEKDGLVRVFDAYPERPTYRFLRGNEGRPDLENPLDAALPEALGGDLDIRPVALPSTDALAGKEAPDGRGSSSRAVAARRSSGGGPPSEHRPSTSTGRRLALARWITDARNPLTARVAVNHIWLRHFGAPLVANVVDFGFRTPEPVFVELLDWLAVELVESGWSMKRLHFLIVTSEAYRRVSGGTSLPSVSLKKDIDNRCFWRMNHRRLEAEAIRDSILAASGRLDRRMGGREIALEEGDTSRRRSVYFRHGNERQVEFLRVFDGASVLECYRRQTSVLPQQALALTNAVVSLEHSRLLARRLGGELPRELPQPASGGPEIEFIRVAFERVLGRRATPGELSRCLDFMASQRRLFEGGDGLTYSVTGPECRVPPSSDPRERARESLVHVLFNHNDFVTVR